MAAKSKKTVTINRALFCIVLLAFVVPIIVVRTIKVKVMDVEKAETYIEKHLKPFQTAPALRGNILACDGRILACSLPQYVIYMDPVAPHDSVFNRNISKLSRQLASFYGDMSADQYRANIERARSRGVEYMRINSRKLSYAEKQEVSKFAMFELGTNKGGFLPSEIGMRKKPFGMLAERTIGEINQEEGRGKVGIEHGFNKALRGQDGKKYRVKLTGRLIDEIVEAPVNGYDIRTTIDVDIQDVAESSLKRQLERYEADYGVAILMEVSTGKIKAIANLSRNKQGNYVENYNHAIGSLVEPGSTFKLATMIACMEDGLAQPEDTINTFRGEYKFYDRTMRDSKEGGHGIITLKEAFEVSSNVAFSRLVWNKYGDDPQAFVDRLRDLGLCDSLGLDIIGEKRTHIKNPGDKTWSGTSLPWMSIGYEMQITPLQLLTFYNAVANNGTMMRPMFVEALMSHGDEVATMRPKVLRNSIASRKTLRAVREMLKGVVEDGTAKNISGTQYKIAGKTGTAQIARGGAGYGREYERKYLASFAGYFPADAPLYSCIVSVSGPKNVFYGNTVAGTVVKAIADRVYAAEFRTGNVRQTNNIVESDVYPYSKGGPYADISTVCGELSLAYSRNIDQKDAWVSTVAKDKSIKLEMKRFLENRTPDVRGMGASDAVSLLESRGFRVQVRGVGRVKSQSIPPSSTYVKGTTTILIELTNG